MSNKKHKFDVIEDTGGGLTLYVYNDSGDVIYAHTGYEFCRFQLTQDLASLERGESPESWDGDEVSLHNDNTRSGDLGEVVADQDGRYPARMGMAASFEFDCDDD